MTTRGVKPNPDRIFMAQRLAFSKSRAQAVFRKEPWEFIREDWIDLWKPLWQSRGRGSDQLCMMRLDYSKPWQHDNIMIITNKVRLGSHQKKHHIGRTYNWKRNEPQ